MRFHSWLRPLLFVFAFLAFSAAAHAQVRVGISVGFAPPELPVYEQPLCPGDDYIWTPGFWAWDDDGDDYYWVPGTWVLAPEPGYFWTPPYWGWGGSAFIFHEGYWGPVVGFYGGISYGYGYSGHGYEGGRWDNGHFYYNRAVNNVNVTVVHNVYNTTIVNRTENRISYNGGQGGIEARPTGQEEAAARERHVPPLAAQTQHIQQARGNPQFRASQNHGAPPVAATAKPAEFNSGVTRATSAGHYNPPPKTNTNANAPHNNNGAPANAPRTAVHPNDLPPHDRPAAVNTNSSKAEQKYQRQQQNLYNQQQQDHQKLQQKQEQDHQRLAQQQADEAKKQQQEQHHQQQTQQMEQKHAQQQQKMQQHQPPPQQAPHEPPPPHEASKPKP